MTPSNHSPLVSHQIAVLADLSGAIFQRKALESIAEHLGDMHIAEVSFPPLDLEGLRGEMEIAAAFEHIAKCEGTEEILEGIKRCAERIRNCSDSAVIIPDHILHPAEPPLIGTLNQNDIQVFVRLSRLHFEANHENASLTEYIEYEAPRRHSDVKELTKDHSWVEVARSVFDQKFGSDRVRTMGTDPLPQSAKVIWVNGGDLSFLQGVEKVLQANRDVVLLPLWLPQSTSKGNLYHARLSKPDPLAEPEDLKKIWGREISDMLQQMFNGTYILEELPLLEVEVFERTIEGLGKKVTSSRFAVNEIICKESGDDRTAHFDVSLDPIASPVRCLGDGVMVTTGIGRQVGSWFSNMTDPHLIPSLLRDRFFPLAVYKNMNGQTGNNEPIPGIIPGNNGDAVPLPYNIVPINGALYVSPVRGGANYIRVDDSPPLELKLGQVAKISMSDRRVWIVKFPESDTDQ